MESKLTLCQRFQSLKNHINTELRGIRATYSEEIEYVTNQIDSLAFYIKDNLKYNDSSAIAQTTLIARVASDAQNENAYAESVVPTANNFFDICRSSDECVAQDELVLLNHNSISWIDLDRGSAASIHGGNATSGHSDNENGQSEESLAQTLSLIYDEVLAIEKQNIVASTNELEPSICSRSEDTKEELMGQDIEEQSKEGHHQQMKLERNRNQSVNVKRDRKRRALIKSLQASIYVNGIQSLAHNRQQHLHRLESEKEIEWPIVLKLQAISVIDDPWLQTWKSSKERIFLSSSNKQHSFRKTFIDPRRSTKSSLSDA